MDLSTSWVESWNGVIYGDLALVFLIDIVRREGQVKDCGDYIE
jgi:hypothetical protein